MTREQAKELLPIITAYSEGKVIEIKGGDGQWFELFEPDFAKDPKNYRIKPDFKYCPFTSARECWNEMLKHQPFGWIKFKNKNENGYIHFEVISDYGISFNPDTTFTFKEMFERYTFLDGDLFGMKSKVRNLSQKQRPFPKIVRK